MLKPLALAGLILTAAGVSQAEPRPERHAQVLLDALREISGVPGMGAAVWQGDRLRWQGSSGLRDIEQRLPVQGDTRFRLASVSKPFAAVAAAQLRVQGRLDVDGALGPLLPELEPTLAALTPRLLAAHLSGLPHYEARDAGRGGSHHATARSSLGYLKDRTLRSVPGSRYLYSSWGYTLLAAAAEAAGGKPYLELLATRVAPGLAIGPDETGRSSAMTKAYDFGVMGLHEAAPHDYSYSWGGAGLAGTAPALAEWGGRLLQGRVVDVATRDWMWQPVLDNAGQPVGERTYKMGFGWRLDTDAEGQKTVHHAGVTAGARSVLLMWPQGRDAGTSVSLLSNAMWTSSIERSAELLSAPLRAPLPGLQPQPCPVEVSRFEGELDGAALAGRARFRRDADGLCRGELGLPAALARVVNPGPQPAADKLAVIGLQGELARAALVTPIGLADWRAQADGSVLVDNLASRRLAIRLQQ
ncbi:CubicO group peptidase (beta-lactamase class C family) [Pelomonas saccharophila]|uniref:CubicO group peptidase (Beta-lactamase class C family) n=1 Tax=Roseateles saccharophilus TaxID=304 RepID=A0ABU1YM46_ROSSA|nr:serine hydrolase domain-containing protein [Roseateles saccharophilus]MDR7269927.1 CubicO group peptidase (beta-lactamase class C family) [Roseateles saccharophilus]